MSKTEVVYVVTSLDQVIGVYVDLQAAKDSVTWTPFKDGLKSRKWVQTAPDILRYVCAYETSYIDDYVYDTQFKIITMVVQ